jgi:hypothetical protein
MLLQEPFVRGRTFEETLLDLPGGPLDQREHQRVGVVGDASQVDHADNVPGRGIGDRDRGTGQPRQRVGEVFPALDQCRTVPLERSADRVRADLLFAVHEARGELNAVEQADRGVVTRSPGDDLSPLVGQNQADPGAFEVAPHPVDHRSGCPAEPATVVNVIVVGHGEPVVP